MSPGSHSPMTLDLPRGLALTSCDGASVHERELARQFCLDLIKEVYGTDYRPDWHADLDSLAGDEQLSWFSPHRGGAFWTIRTDNLGIVASAGLYRLDWKPSLLASLPGRYQNPTAVAQLVRVYIREDFRGRGLGRRLAAFAESEARRLGYSTLYLHADSGTPATIAFWLASGFSRFASGDGTTHFDKPISPDAS